MDPQVVASALSGHQNASEHRMDVRTRRDGVTTIDDSYNANPDSMHAAIAALAYTSAARPDARAIAVLGEMGELGGEAVAAHRTLGEVLSKYHVGYLVAVGDNENMRAMVEAARAQGINTTISPDVDTAAAAVEDIIRVAPAGIEDWAEREAKDVVLIKSSNAQRLWRVAEQLNRH